MSDPHQPKLSGVIGWPISHSLSPLIHKTWAEREQVNAHYIPIPAEPTFDDFARIVRGLAAAGFSGVNVTIPHKEHALQLADSASNEAKAIGAANMLSFQNDQIIADNSDAYGFAHAVKPHLKKADGSVSALVIGAGGAARGVVFALQQLIENIGKITITNRTRQRADLVADDFGIDVLAWDSRNDGASAAGLVINTTSLGMTGEPPLDLHTTFKPDDVVCDIVYSPLETPLLTKAARDGARTVNGLDMLMYQAQPGYSRWLGSEAIVDEDLRARLIAALSKRSAS